MTPEVVKDSNAAYFACNAEQRILKGILDDENAKVRFIHEKTDSSLCEAGIHFCFLRADWKTATRYNLREDAQKSATQLYTLNKTV